MFVKRILFVAILSMVCCSWSPYSEGATYYLPYYSNANGSATGVGLTNLSVVEKASATIAVYGNEGGLKKSQAVEIDLGGQWSGVVAFTSPVDGWLQIESNVPLAGLSFGIENGVMMDVPIADVLSNYLLVPHVAQDETWDSVFFMANPNSQKAVVSLKYRDTSGQTVAVKSVEILAMGSAELKMTELLGGIEVSGGSVFIESDRKITAFSLYNNLKTGAGWNAGINAIAVDASVYDDDTEDDLLTQGLVALGNGEIINAKAIFESAVSGAGNLSANDADTANFLYALCRVAALWFDMDSDGNANNGLQTLGDIFDAFGFPDQGRDPKDFHPNDLFTESLPASSPTGADLQDFLYDVVRPEIEGALQNLSRVSATFRADWWEPFDGTRVESDYGDVLFFKAVSRAMLATIRVQKAYNLDIDIASLVNHDTMTLEVFLKNHPQLLSLTGGAHLVVAETLIRQGLDDMDSAIDLMVSETDDQSDDLISLADMTAEGISELQNQLADVDAALDGRFTLEDNDTPSNQNDDTVVELGLFFDGLDLRSLLPSFSGDAPSGLLPDPSFGGVLVKWEGSAPAGLNRDLNGNGTADIFED